MRWDGSSGRHNILSILESQVPSHVRVDLLVQRLDLSPESSKLILTVISLIVAQPPFCYAVVTWKYNVVKEVDITIEKMLNYTFLD